MVSKNRIDNVVTQEKKLGKIIIVSYLLESKSPLGRNRYSFTRCVPLFKCPPLEIARAYSKSKHIT